MAGKILKVFPITEGKRGETLWKAAEPTPPLPPHGLYGLCQVSNYGVNNKPVTHTSS